VVKTKTRKKPDQSDVDKLVNAFKKRRDAHGMFDKKWSNYINDLLNMYMFDNIKIWDLYDQNKL